MRIALARLITIVILGVLIYAALDVQYGVATAKTVILAYALFSVRFYELLAPLDVISPRSIP